MLKSNNFFISLNFQDLEYIFGSLCLHPLLIWRECTKKTTNNIYNPAVLFVYKFFQADYFIARRCGFYNLHFNQICQQNFIQICLSYRDLTIIFNLLIWIFRNNYSTSLAKTHVPSLCKKRKRFFCQKTTVHFCIICLHYFVYQHHH